MEDPDVAAAARADPFDARLVADEEADFLGALSEDVRDAEVPDPAMRVPTEERPGKVVVLAEALWWRRPAGIVQTSFAIITSYSGSH